MKQFRTFLYETTIHTMRMATVHCKGSLSQDTQAADICCADIMSAKISNVECFFKPHHQGGVSYPGNSKCPKLSLTNFLAHKNLPFVYLFWSNIRTF